MLLLLGTCIYLVAHFVRALRFWLVYEEHRLRLSFLFIAYQVASSVGGFAPGFAIELVRVFAIIGAAGRSKSLKVILVTVVCRAFDVFVLCMPHLIYFLFWPEHGWSGTILLFGLFLGLGLVLLLSSPGPLAFIKTLVITRKHSRGGEIMVRWLSELQYALKTIVHQAGHRWPLVFVLTVFIWLLDTLALWTVASGLMTVTLPSTLDFWINHSFSKLAQFRVPISEELSHALHRLIEMQGILTLFVVIFYIIHQRSKRGQVTASHR